MTSVCFCDNCTNVIRGISPNFDCPRLSDFNWVEQYRFCCCEKSRFYIPEHNCMLRREHLATKCRCFGCDFNPNHNHLLETPHGNLDCRHKNCPVGDVVNGLFHLMVTALWFMPNKESLPEKVIGVAADALKHGRYDSRKNRAEEEEAEERWRQRQ